MIFGQTDQRRNEIHNIKREIFEAGHIPHYVFTPLPTRLNNGKIVWLQRVIEVVEIPYGNSRFTCVWPTRYFANGQELKEYLKCNGTTYVDDDEKVIEIVDQLHEMYTKKVLELQSKL